MTIRSAVLIGCQRVTDGRTDRQTDGRTDVKPIAITCFSIADARKNGKYKIEIAKNIEVYVLNTTPES